MTDPNFLFSLPPFVEVRDGTNYIVLRPSGGDDGPQFQAATDRLFAVGGGTIRLSAGDFTMTEAFWIDDSIRFG